MQGIAGTQHKVSDAEAKCIMRVEKRALQSGKKTIP
jgi:hypothetical protein